MKLRLLTVLATAAIAGLLPPAAHPHHSFSAHYDTDTRIEVTGTVTEMSLVNPHSRIVMNVENAQGETEVWLVEMNSYNRLRRQGWKKTDLKAGDRITVRGEAGWNGKKMVHARSVVMPNGDVRGGQRRQGGE